MTDATDTAAGWYSEEAATFGDRVAGAREAIGLSQEDLARRLGVKLKTIHGWENDLTEPRANKLQMLAGVLNVSIMWLLTGEGHGLDEPAEAEMYSHDLTEIFAEIRALKGQLGRTADQLGRVEKRLRAALKAQS